MQIGRLSWVSPKGYGLVTLEEGGNAFVPVHIVDENKDMEGKRVRVSLSQGSIGKVVTRMGKISEPLFDHSGL